MVRPRHSVTAPELGEWEGNPSHGPWFEIRFNPSVELITIVRRFVEDFYRKVVDEEAASRLAIATHELLENAAKYSMDGAAVLHVQVDSAAGTVDVRTTNRANPKVREELQAFIDEITAAEDSNALYATMLERSATSNERRIGGLGLVRIRAESEMSIRLAITGDVVEVHAQGLLVSAG